MMDRRRFIAISAAAFGAGITESSAAQRPETVWRGRAFGADAHIILRGDNAAPAMQAALDTIQRLERYFSIYDPGSLISKLNKTGRLTMPPEFARLMDEVEKAHQTTNGLFDPTIQPLFANRLTVKNGTTYPNIGWHLVERTANHIQFLEPGMAITLNGIAQGFATDRVSEVLAAHGFGSVLVNIGEYKIGDKPAALTVENTKGKTLTKQWLSNAAMATSSQNGFTFSDGAGHILPPDNSQAPAVWETVSVVAASATMADGYSTALILSPDLAHAQQLISAGQVQSIVLEKSDGEIIRL